jgi:hypothetical protein
MTISCLVDILENWIYIRFDFEVECKEIIDRSPGYKNSTNKYNKQ